MRSVAASFLLFLAGLSVLAAALGTPPVPATFPVRASAPTAALWLGASPATVGLNDTLTYTIWVNVSGSGQFQSASVNLSLSAAPNMTSPAILLTAGAATTPPECTPSAADSWDCLNLRAGSAYRWTIPAQVWKSGSVGYFEWANATLVAVSGGVREILDASARVWIAGAPMSLHVSSSPAFTARAGDLIWFWINATNTADVEDDPTATAYNVTLTITLDRWLSLGPGSPSLVTDAGSLSANSTIAYAIQVVVAGNASPGTVVGIRANLDYQDFNLHPLRLESRSAPIYIRTGEVVSTPNLIAAAAIGLAAIVATLMVLLYVGQRKLAIDEAFLMHRSGVLIHHVSRGPDLKKDDDLVASMFVAIQEFVRDSFKSEALLDELSFGGRKAAVVRGEHTILAAVISRGDVEYLTPQMLAALRAVEATYGRVLGAWDGRMAKLTGVDRILERFLRGGYRSAWRARLT